MSETIKIVDVTTGEEIERQMTKEELAQREIDLENEVAKKAAEQLKAATRQSILDRLGITEEEARLLLG